ncbi:MAG: PGPGW domain-containing protein [Proteobacteria bacterium]|nr:PGPGW domain-containing protein [Pseudomonadota bacterium]MBU4298316.1 PGPGW domain-containing protein [Pseudomonadota bacterium]MCG2748890.1 PGPGW domain-containing protein [Desulfobulbaceae bacterium]
MLNFFYLHEEAILWLTALSVVTFIGSLIIVPLLVIRIPSDYFANDKRHQTPWALHHPFVRGTLLFTKNLVGYVCILAGILMLVLPGQGLLTIFIGIMMLDFPGKFRLEKWLVTRRTVLKSINWLRKRAKRTPLNLNF